MGANSCVKRGKSDIFAGVVEMLRVLMVGLVMRVSWFGTRRIVVRRDCMYVFRIVGLMVEDGRMSGGLYTCGT